MGDERLAQLRQLLALTEEILSDARDKRWDALMEKEQARRRLMERFFQEHADAVIEGPMEEMIRQIMILDKKIISLAESAKLDILKKMRDLSAGRQAIDAYVSNSS